MKFSGNYEAGNLAPGTSPGGIRITVQFKLVASNPELPTSVGYISNGPHYLFQGPLIRLVGSNIRGVARINLTYWASMTSFTLSSTFLAVVSYAAVISATPANVVERACTPMSQAEFNSLSADAHNAIDSAALKDHGDHSHNLVVNDQDFPGSPANVCDNVATGTVWVEYNDSIDGHFKCKKWALLCLFVKWGKSSQQPEKDLCVE
ncbi:hypothetical protein C8R43DRAFT_943416 [Mycena crocata]|nr:hypothetical protein C8R43DRAFT_943416 [Mycena crocata]